MGLACFGGRQVPARIPLLALLSGGTFMLAPVVRLLPDGLSFLRPILFTARGLVLRVVLLQAHGLESVPFGAL